MMMNAKQTFRAAFSFFRRVARVANAGGQTSASSDRVAVRGVPSVNPFATSLQLDFDDEIESSYDHEAMRAAIVCAADRFPFVAVVG